MVSQGVSTSTQLTIINSFPPNDAIWRHAWSPISLWVFMWGFKVASTCMGFADEKMIKLNGDENRPEQGTTPQQQVRIREN